MYVRLVRFALADGKHDVAKKLADDLGPQISHQPGFRSLVFYTDDSDGESGIIVLWDSAEAADAAAAVMSPQLQKHLAGNVKRPPEKDLFKVIASTP